MWSIVCTSAELNSEENEIYMFEHSKTGCVFFDARCTVSVEKW